jgi:large-conductance mechanosensitive channel
MTELGFALLSEGFLTYIYYLLANAFFPRSAPARWKEAAAYAGIFILLFILGPYTEYDFLVHLITAAFLAFLIYHSRIMKGMLFIAVSELILYAGYYLTHTLLAFSMLIALQGTTIVYSSLSVTVTRLLQFLFTEIVCLLPLNHSDLPTKRYVWALFTIIPFLSILAVVFILLNLSISYGAMILLSSYFLLVSIIVFLLFQYTSTIQKKQAEAELQATRDRYEISQLQAMQESNEKMHELRHNLNNIITALKAEKADNSRLVQELNETAEAYISEQALCGNRQSYHRQRHQLQAAQL